MTESIVLEKLNNNNGMEIGLINVGATLTSITFPGIGGGRDELTLGFESSEAYIENPPYFGSTPGRVASRITGGRFELNGRTYNLQRNAGQHTLHGGNPGFGSRYWKCIRDDQANSVTYNYVSPAGENGFPGTLDATVRYCLNNENEIIIEYFAETDEDTVINLTNHAYFNFSGGKTTIRDHLLYLACDYYVVTDKNDVPTGELRPTSGTPMDFSVPRRLGEAIDSDFEAIKKVGGLDTCFAVKGEGLRRAAVLSDPATGYRLEVDTDMPGIVVYTAQLLPKGTKGRGGLIYGPFSGVCLEAQNLMDAPNQPDFPSPVLRKGDIYKRTIIYRFSKEEIS